MSLLNRSIDILKEEGIDVFIKKSSAYIKQKIKQELGFCILPYAIFKIRGFNTKKHELNVPLNFSFNGIGGLIKPMQIQEEILTLLRILNNIKPKVVLEIGTANGGTLFLFTRVASEDATLISIDLPGGVFGGGYPLWKIPLYKSFALPNQKIYLIRDDSHSPSTLKKVQQILDGRKVDFLFIDGDHSYEGVKKDFEMYSPLVREGGIIAFHDIVLGPEYNVGGVPRFWKEIKRKYKYKEIVKDWNQNGWGIGIIFKGVK